MDTLLIVILVLILFGGGFGVSSYRGGNVQLGGALGLCVTILIIFVLLRILRLV